jgi:hypothetical protein
MGKPQEAIPALRKAVDLGNKRRAADPNARDMVGEALKDAHCMSIRETPEFKQIVGAK